MNATFVTVALIGVPAVMFPGPDFLIVTRNSLYSRRIGVATALGIVAGNVWWIAASILGISYLISRVLLLFTILKWFGALYLIYLGVCALRTKQKVDLSEKAPGVSVNPENAENLTWSPAFRIGFFTNILNPKCALFFVSFFSVIITPTTPVLFQCLYGLEIMLIAVAWFSFWATFVSILRSKAWFRHILNWVDRVTGVLFIALGVKVALYQQK